MLGNVLFFFLFCFVIYKYTMFTSELTVFSLYSCNDSQCTRLLSWQPSLQEGRWLEWAHRLITQDGIKKPNFSNKLTIPWKFCFHSTRFLCRRGGLVVSALESGPGGPGLSPGQGHCTVLLGKTLNSHSASLHSRIQMSTELDAGGNYINLRWTSIPSRRE